MGQAQAPEERCGKAAPLNLHRQSLGTGRDDPHVHRNGLVVIRPPDRTLLDGVEHSILELGREGGDLLDQQGASRGLREDSWELVYPRWPVLERAEELGLQQVLRYCFTPHCDEGTLVPSRQPVDRPGEDLLPSATLSRDQDGDVLRGYGRRQIQHATHGLALGHNLAVQGMGTQRRPEGPDLAQ